MIRRYLNYRRLAVLMTAWPSCFIPIVGKYLPDMQKGGARRHLGIPDACFVTGGGDGLNDALTRPDTQSTGL